MTTTLPERPGLPGSAGNGPPLEPSGFLSAYPGYRSTALLDQLRAAGGSVYIASVQAGWHALAANEARFEDGTLSFLQIPPNAAINRCAKAPRPRRPAGRRSPLPRPKEPASVRR